MTLISKVSKAYLLTIQDSITNSIANCEYLEDAAQKYMTILYNELSESIILARFFATVSMKSLPSKDRSFVTRLAKDKRIDGLLSEDTPVLSLLGSIGVSDKWSDRTSSIGHLGIPLVSSQFIDAIPMMSRLLKQMGLGLEWIDKNDTALVVRTAGKMGGLFFVGNAATELDSSGRKIIAAQDFVRDYHVRSVFGLGGGYLGTDIFFTTIIFTSEQLTKERVQRFILQVNKFKTSTMEIALDGNIYNSQ